MKIVLLDHFAFGSMVTILVWIVYLKAEALKSDPHLLKFSRDWETISWELPRSFRLLVIQSRAETAVFSGNGLVTPPTHGR